MFAKELGDSGWWGGWVELAFTVTQANPFITTPRGIGRIGEMNVCTFPVPIENSFFEYLAYGFGRWPKSACATTRCAPLQAHERNVVPTFSDLTTTAKLRVYPTDTADVNLRVLVQGLDGNGIPIRTLDGLVQVSGEFVTLEAPFADTVNSYSVITGLQKDVTFGRVNFYQLDPTTADETLISFMEPGETVAGYRRYYVSGLPKNCCGVPVTSTDVQVTALARLEYIPVAVPTDYLIVPNVEALTQEAQSARYDRMDDPQMKANALLHHRNAVRLLQGQSVAMEGKLKPAVSFSPFGSARLELQKIGTLI